MEQSKIIDTLETYQPPFDGPRPHLSPNGPQAPQDQLFPDDHIQLPGHGGNFYEDYYGNV